MEVYADDGDDVSSTVAASLTVSNSAPTDPGLDWNGTPDPESALPCVVDTESTDADEDDITYVFTWEIDEVEYTGATTTTYGGDTLPAGAWALGDDVRCYVTAEDGTDTSNQVELRAILPPCDTATITQDTNGRYYVFCDDGETWSDAVDSCRSMGGTWDLASIVDSTENDHVDTEAQDAITPVAAGHSSLWIGLSDADTEGTWTWSDGSTDTYTEWGAGEPNGGTSSNCAHMRAGGSYDGSWNDIACSNSPGYVCAEP